MDQLDLQPDGDGQFRVTEFFCHDDTWKLTLARLADDSDAVLMDLRAFSQSNAGCIFEISELFNLVPLQRLVFILDESTDQKFMRETMLEAWMRSAKLPATVEFLSLKIRRKLRAPSTAANARRDLE